MKARRGYLYAGWYSQRELAGRFAYRCICCGALFLIKTEALTCCPQKYRRLFDVAQHSGHCKVETLVPYSLPRAVAGGVDTDLWEPFIQHAKGWRSIIGHLPANNEAKEVWLEHNLNIRG